MQPYDPIAEARRRLIGAPRIAAAWVFGSIARGTERSDSDVDVALLAAQPGDRLTRDLSLLADLQARLEAAFPGRRIDLVDAEAVGPIFRHEILRDGIRVLDVDRARRVAYEADATVRYLDFLPTFRIAEERAIGGFRRWLRSVA